MQVRIPNHRPPFALGASSRVALGILLSKIAGLVRDLIFAHFFGSSVVADAFRGAMRIPNLLANLLGEGVLSASFVTVYAKLLAFGEKEAAEHLAAAVFGILGLFCSVLVIVGVLLAPYLVDVITPGFGGERRALTIQIVRILFPGAGLMVMSAWCLGVLNSHRRFLLSYTAPVMWNAAMIATMLLLGGLRQRELAIDLAWGSVIGSGLQFMVQLPRVLKLLPAFRPVLGRHSEHVRVVVRNFGPVFVSRGVVQVSAYIDSIIASWLPIGAMAYLVYGQALAMLPIGLFSMSVSAAELPALSGAVGNQEEIGGFLRRRLSLGLRRIAFFVIPSAAAFLVLGDVIAAGIYQSGKFTHNDAVFVWAVLAGAAVGLLASSLGRLYSSAFYALLDTRTPLRFAIIRVTITTALGFFSALVLPGWLGVNARWGVAGLTASAGVAGWVEFTLLRRALARRIGATPLGVDFIAKLWSMALIAAGAGFGIKIALGTDHPKPLLIIVVVAYAILYFAGTMAMGVEEAKTALLTFMRPFRLK
ncbi:MAG TPA: murein biosynthesis integral membrane protein MurJ [Bryobacteraceae bacterium]